MEANARSMLNPRDLSLRDDLSFALLAWSEITPLLWIIVL